MESASFMPHIGETVLPEALAATMLNGIAPLSAPKWLTDFQEKERSAMKEATAQGRRFRRAIDRILNRPGRQQFVSHAPMIRRGNAH